MATKAETDSLTTAHSTLGSTTESHEQCNAETKKQESLWVIYLSMYLTMLGLAIGISSTWPYLQKIDRHVSPQFLGWTFVSFNIAAICGDFCFGFWLRCRPNREPMIGIALVSILSPIVFVFAQRMERSMGLIAVLISRALLGFTRGNMTITRSILSESTTVSERSAAMACLIISMTLGFASGSGIQALIALMGERSYYVSDLKLNIDLYTIPAFLLIFLNIINAFLSFYFVKPTPNDSFSEEASVTAAKKDKKQSLIVLSVLFIMFGLVNFTLSFMESLMIPFIQHQYTLTRPRAVSYGGLVFTSQGIVGCFVQFAAMRFLFKRFSDRRLIVIAYICLVINFILYIPMGGNRLKLESSSVNSTLNGTLQDSTDGCPREYDWCRDTPQIYLPQFVAAAVLFSIGYSSCLGLLVSLFTKLIDSGDQSTRVGLISACGNVGRLAAPIIGTSSYVHLGPQYTFAWMALILFVTFFAFLCQYRQMKPGKFKKSELLGLTDQRNNAIQISGTYFVTPV